MQDDPIPTRGAETVCDVYTKSQDTGLDGTNYKDWWKWQCLRINVAAASP